MVTRYRYFKAREGILTLEHTWAFEVDFTNEQTATPHPHQETRLRGLTHILPVAVPNRGAPLWINKIALMINISKLYGAKESNLMESHVVNYFMPILKLWRKMSTKKGEIKE